MLGHPVIVFSPTKGRHHEAIDSKRIESARWFLEEGLIKIYCPDSLDAYSRYNRNISLANRVKNHL